MCHQLAMWVCEGHWNFSQGTTTDAEWKRTSRTIWVPVLCVKRSNQTTRLRPVCSSPWKFYAKMGACDYRPGDGFTIVEWLYGHCGLCGLHDKNSPLCPLYKGGDSARVRHDSCRHYLLTTWPPWSDHLWIGYQIYQQVLDQPVELAWYYSLVQHGFPPTNRWSVRKDDPDLEEFLEAICQEESFKVDTTLGLSWICNQQCY